MTPVAAAAAFDALLLFAFALFQAALALGVPLGRFAWGGTHGDVLPPRLQIASAAAVPLVLAMMMIVLVRAGLLYPALSPAMVWPHWAVFLYLVINTFANLRSDSADERRVMGPWAGAMAALTGYVAIMLG